MIVWRWQTLEPFVGKPLVLIGTGAHFESVSAREASLLTEFAPRRSENGGLGDDGECACVTNSKGEALAVLDRRDIPLDIRQLGIDISTRNNKVNVTPIAGLVWAYIKEERKMLTTVALLYVHFMLLNIVLGFYPIHVIITRQTYSYFGTYQILYNGTHKYFSKLGFLYFIHLLVNWHSRHTNNVPLFILMKVSNNY